MTQQTNNLHQMQQQSLTKQSEPETSGAKYNKTIAFIEEELYLTLTYLDAQIERADIQAEDVTKFSKSVYEAKKLLVEQKIHVLKHLSSLAVDKLKLSTGSESDISDITSLFS